MHRIKLGVSTAQLKKLQKGEGIQLSHDQLTKVSPKVRHLVELDVHPDMIKKIGGAINRGKAVRMQPQHFNGGSLTSMFKKVGSTF